MAQNKFKGLGIALITPFKSDGEVDYEALTRLVEYQIRNAWISCVLWERRPKHLASRLTRRRY